MVFAAIFTLLLVTARKMIQLLHQMQKVKENKEHKRKTDEIADDLPK